MSVIAQKPLPTAGLGGSIGSGDTGSFGPFVTISDATTTIKNIATGLSNLIGFLTILGGLWFGFHFFLGAFQWMTSGGDKAKLESARNRLVHAFTGLIIIVATWAILAVISLIFDLDILLSDPAKIACLLDPSKPDKSQCPY